MWRQTGEGGEGEKFISHKIVATRRTSAGGGGTAGTAVEAMVAVWVHQRVARGAGAVTGKDRDPKAEIA